MFQYADHLQRLFNITPPQFVCVAFNEPTDEDIFRERFGSSNVHQIPDWPDGASGAHDLVRRLNISHLYLHKSHADGILSKHTTNLVHFVFNGNKVEGQRHARISSAVPGSGPIVPYMVIPPVPGNDTFRAELRIPEKATVFGRYGGMSSFNVPFVHKVLLEQKFPGVFFIFANTANFCPDEKCPPNIIFVPNLKGAMQKAKFIRTSDAMLHARAEGETFGLAIAEFAVCNKPVVTLDANPFEIQMQELGERALKYSDAESLIRIIRGFNRSAPLAPGSPYQSYQPAAVTQKFYSVFLNGTQPKKFCAH